MVDFVAVVFNFQIFSDLNKEIDCFSKNETVRTCAEIAVTKLSLLSKLDF